MAKIIPTMSVAHIMCPIFCFKNENNKVYSEIHREKWNNDKSPRVAPQDLTLVFPENGFDYFILKKAEEK